MIILDFAKQIKIKILIRLFLVVMKFKKNL